MDPLRKPLFDHLESYLSGAITLDELKDWLVGATWHIEETAPPETVQLAYAIELVLAEESGGYLTKDELHMDLRALATRMSAAA